MLLDGDDPMHQSEDYRHLLKDQSSYLLNTIEESLVGIKIENWESFGGYAPENRPQNKVRKGSMTEAFVSWLSTFEPGETRSKTDFEQKMGLTANQKQSLRVALTPKKDKAGNPKPLSPQLRAMKSMNITKKSVSGTGTVFTKADK